MTIADNGGLVNAEQLGEGGGGEGLAVALVIPINNPVQKAPYNGAIEPTQGDFKAYIQQWQFKAERVKRMALL